MSTLKNVGNKIFKTELESHKVELGLLDDISSFLKNYSIADDVAPIRQAAEKAENSLNSKKSKLDDVLKQIEKGKQMAKELGLPLNEFEKWEVFANGQMKGTNTLIKNVQSAKMVDNR